MEKLFVYFFICSFIFAIEKYKEEDILSVWKINDKNPQLISFKTKDSLGILNSQKRQKELLDIILKFYPKEVTDKIDKFIIFSDNNSHNEGGLSGLVEDSKTQDKPFNLSIDISDAYFKDYLDLEGLLTLLVHEFFHIISLDESQLSQQATGELRISQGYTKSNSYINKFYEKFWNNSFAKKLDLLENEMKLTYEEKKQLRTELYEKNRDKFVNEYAMTNIVEDIAVSFEAFVKNNRNHLGDSLKDKKIDFFYSYKELENYKSFFLQKRKELIK